MKLERKYKTVLFHIVINMNAERWIVQMPLKIYCLSALGIIFRQIEQDAGIAVRAINISHKKIKYIYIYIYKLETE